MIKSIIFDIGNVLAYFCWSESYKKRLSEEEYELIAKATVLDEKTWVEIDKGVLNFDELIELFSKDIPHLKDKMRDALIGTFSDIVPYHYSEDWVKAYKSRGFNVYLLSNYGDYSFELSRPRFTFADHVDGAVISYQINKIKPDPEIYRFICDKYSIVPSEAIFIDDNLDNVESARRFGLNAVRFKTYEQAINEIEELIGE